MDYDYLVFIGRFEPFHNGHLAVARYGLTRARKIVFLVGSADTPRTIKNPWTVAERTVMIESALADAASRLSRYRSRVLVVRGAAGVRHVAVRADCAVASLGHRRVAGRARRVQH